MKFVYVLTSSSNDLYYEQFLLSVTSCRLYNPNAYIVVLLNSKTKQGLVNNRTAYEPLVNEIKVIFPPAEFSQKEASRWIKTSIHHYITGDFLFIDCDTIIAEALPSKFSPNVQVGAILDTHVSLEQHHLRSHFQKEDLDAGFFSSLKTNTRYNGGLIYCKNDFPARNFYEKWHTLWLEGRKNGCTQDMPSLNQANYELDSIITELPGEWNCQISHNGLLFLSTAKIIHYYATSLLAFDTPYLLASANVLREIKSNGVITDDMLIMLKNPKSAFAWNSRIIADQVIFDILESGFFSKLLWLRRKHEKMFWKINDLINYIKKPSYLVKLWLKK